MIPLVEKGRPGVNEVVSIKQGLGAWDVVPIP